MNSLSNRLPTICSTIFAHLGSQQTEATYQCCLKIDLEQAGVEVLLEPVMELLYKGQVVGTRRADLVLKLKSGKKVVVEFKAVDQMTCDHVKQLQFYAHHMGIHRGYLITFPHDSSFPSVEGDTFSISHLCGMRNKLEHLILGGAGSNLRLRNSPGTRLVEILEMHGKSVTRKEIRGDLIAIKKEVDSSSSHPLPRHDHLVVSALRKQTNGARYVSANKGFVSITKINNLRGEEIYRGRWPTNIGKSL